MNWGPEGPANPCPSSSLSDEDELDSESEAAAKNRDIFQYVSCYQKQFSSGAENIQRFD